MTPNKLVYAGLALALVGGAQAAVITLNSGGDGSGTSSFNSAGSWSNGIAPSSGNTYETSVTWLRSPGASGTFVFGGDSLTLKSGGAILNKNSGAQTLSANFILDGGFVRSGAGLTDTFTMDGTINITSNGGGIIPDQSPYVIAASLTGSSGTLVFSGNAADVGSSATGPGRGLTFTGSSTFTGNLDIKTIGSGSVTFTDTSSWTFAIGSSGVNNTIANADTLNLNGIIKIDTTSADLTAGNSWSLITGTTPVYGGTFSVEGFTDSGSGVWTMGNLSFDTSTGVLSVVSAVPEPSTYAALLGALALGAVAYRRRKQS